MRGATAKAIRKQLVKRYPAYSPCLYRCIKRIYAALPHTQKSNTGIRDAITVAVVSVSATAL